MNETTYTPTEARYLALSRELFAAYPGYPASFSDFADALPERSRHALALQNLDGQVTNGGFVQWVENGCLDDDYDVLMPALGRLAGTLEGPALATVQAVIRLVQRAIEVVDRHEPGRVPERVLCELDKLDDPYYSVDEAFRELYMAHILAWA